MAERVVYRPVSVFGRIYIAKVERDAAGRVLRSKVFAAVRSRAYSVDDRGCKSLVWAQDDVEVLSIMQLGSEVVLKIRTGSERDEYVTVDLSEASLDSAQCE